MIPTEARCLPMLLLLLLLLLLRLRPHKRRITSSRCLSRCFFARAACTFVSRCVCLPGALFSGGVLARTHVRTQQHHAVCKGVGCIAFLRSPESQNLEVGVCHHLARLFQAWGNESFSHTCRYMFPRTYCCPSSSSSQRFAVAVNPASFFTRKPELSTSIVLKKKNIAVKQEFFEDIRALFGSLAFRGDGGEGRTSTSTTTNNNAGGACRGDSAKARAAREVNLRTLLDQLQVMKAEPRNHLRCKRGVGRYFFTLKYV